MSLGERLWQNKNEIINSQYFFTDLKPVVADLVKFNSEISVFVFGSIKRYLDG